MKHLAQCRPDRAECFCYARGLSYECTRGIHDECEGAGACTCPRQQPPPCPCRRAVAYRNGTGNLGPCHHHRPTPCRCTRTGPCRCECASWDIPGDHHAIRRTLAA